MYYLDHLVLDFFATHRYEWLTFIMLSITYSGGYLVASVVTILSTISFYIHNHTKFILPLFISMIGSTGTAYVLKHLIERARPIGGLYSESTFSFPSGHATTAVALYGFLIFAIWQQDNHHSKNPSIYILSILILLVGFSRLYLGVHYLSDVLVGLLVGLVWVIIASKITTKHH